MSFVDYVSTPIGELAIVSDEAVRAIGFLEAHPRMQRWLSSSLVRGRARRETY